MSKAQELATLLEKMKSEGWSTQGEDQAATLLRTQDALLRQALDALEFHQRMTRPITNTMEVVDIIKGHLK